jgi:hypothetical protein
LCLSVSTEGRTELGEGVRGLLLRPVPVQRVHEQQPRLRENGHVFECPSFPMSVPSLSW